MFPRLHVHDFSELVTAWHWSSEAGMFWQTIHGYRCRCGAYSFMRHPEQVFDAAANIRMAARYLRERYSL